MQGEWRPLVNYPRSALWYAALAIVPAALGLLAAHGGYLGGAIATWAMIIALPQLVFSLIFSLCCLLAKAFKAAAWYFAMGFVGIALATMPSIIAKYLLTRG